MTLNYKDSQYILRKFPPIKLSYEKNIHKKVFPLDILITIPKGKKFFAWFCKFKNEPVCIFLELDNYKKGIQNIYIFNCCFDSKIAISQGTILYGTIFYFKKTRCFNIENIFYFMNKNISNLNQSKKFKIINNLFQSYIQQVIYTPNDIIFGMPLIDTKRDKIIYKLDTLPYNIYCIQHRSLFNETKFLNEFIKQTRKTTLIFTIKAEIEDDIYTLYYKNKSSQLEAFGTTLIPDFKTSEMMNTLFRNIKENKNLDVLEESDDEEEFEDISIDKNVDLNKQFNFECVYKEKFKSWIPIKQTNETTICKKTDIIF